MSDLKKKMVPVLELQNIHKSFGKGRVQLDVLRGASLYVAPGEIVALLGQSGSGKSTLLQIAALLEKPTDGNIVINGKLADTRQDKNATQLRRDYIGFVYQFHHLLPEFTALENIVLPQLLKGVDREEAKARAEHLLKIVGLSERADHRPSELSGGEQQRVAIMRALANNPAILIADEPTGNLDSVTADTVFGILKQIVKETKVGALIATHNLELAGRMDRILVLEQGKLVDYRK